MLTSAKAVALFAISVVASSRVANSCGIQRRRELRLEPRIITLDTVLLSVFPACIGKSYPHEPNHDENLDGENE